MQYMSVSNARKDLYNIVNKCNEPTMIHGKEQSVVIITAGDWEDIQETLLVSSNKALAKSILKGMKEDYDECSTKIDW